MFLDLGSVHQLNFTLQPSSRSFVQQNNKKSLNTRCTRVTTFKMYSASSNPPAPRQRIIRNAADFFEKEAADRAAALNGANPGNCDDFPEDEAGQLACIDLILEAMDNTEGVIDNDGADKEAISKLPQDKKERMAWRAMVRNIPLVPPPFPSLTRIRLQYKIRDVQMGHHHPDILTVSFPNFMARLKATCALIRVREPGSAHILPADTDTLLVEQGGSHPVLCGAVHRPFHRQPDPGVVCEYHLNRLPLSQP